jgi:fatty acid desaturase
VRGLYSRLVRLYQRSADRRPDPPPLATDDRATVLVGIGLWVVALILTLLFHAWLADADRSWWTWTTLAGIAGGLLGLVYLSRRRRS